MNKDERKGGGGGGDGWSNEWMDGQTAGGETAGARYATYWHRSTGKAHQRESDIYGAAVCAGLPSAADTESRDIVSCAAKTRGRS